jgi:hypothetical protein
LVVLARTSVPPCFSVAMPMVTPALCHADVARVVFGGEDFRQPLSGQIRLQAQGRDAGEGHGQRAATAGFGLAVQVGHGGAGNMGAVLRMSPGQRGQAMLDRGAHQFVIGRVKLHQVDAMAKRSWLLNTGLF